MSEEEMTSDKTTANKTSAKLDWLPALAFLLFGCIFFYASFQIQSFGGGNGARMIPMATSGVVMLLAAYLLLHFFRQSDQFTETHIEAKEFLLYSGPLIGLMALYALFHSWFGYLAATFLCGFMAFKLFGNSWLASLTHAVAGTAVLYVTFVKVLGVYDPAGKLFDLSGLF